MVSESKIYTLMSKKESIKKGFTLIELMVTLMIIGLISSVLYPNFTKIQQKAKESSIKTISHTLQMAIESYYLSEDSYPSGTDIHISELYTSLSKNGSLTKLSNNPFTGTDFDSGDSSGNIIYSFDNSTDIYILTSYGFNNENIILTIDNS
jgi:prepilin-type N-terminal cleavage/methylation domain-containing protein